MKEPKLSVAMLYHTNERKNSKMGLKILKTLKEKYPELNADLFGSIPRPEFLPSWINYIEKASEKEVVQIYNRNTFFLCTSSVEGYGLTGLESLFCGCCLISTNCLGVEEYAKNGFNCLLSEPKDEEAMLKNIVIAIENDNLRRQLTKNSKELINNYKLDKSKQLFAELIKEVIR